MIEQLIKEGTRWVSTERDLRRPMGRSLFDSERSWLSLFFEPATLDKVRIVSVPIIVNPSFYFSIDSELRKGIIDFSNMAGITFSDTVLISQSKSQGMRFDLLLFHEMVHVVQYSLLGTDEFIKRYVYGWNENGRQYEGIPFEKDAYDLQERFAASPGSGFSVTSEIHKRLKMSSK